MEVSKEKYYKLYLGSENIKFQLKCMEFLFCIFFLKSVSLKDVAYSTLNKFSCTFFSQFTFRLKGSDASWEHDEEPPVEVI